MPATVPDTKALANFLNSPGLESDDVKGPLLTEALESAIEYVTDRVGRIDGASRPCRVWDAGRSNRIVLPLTHLEEVLTVTDPSGTEVTINSNTDVDFLAGIVDVPRPVRGTWTFQVRGQDTRYSIVLAIKIIAGHLWETQRGRAGARGQIMGQAEEPTAAAPRGFAIPARAAQLLEPYTLPGWA